ncbi:MAG TPA: hypothetical protein V6C81_30875 [Planktothrix sp.]|jgi:hypothetical protein
MSDAYFNAYTWNQQQRQQPQQGGQDNFQFDGSGAPNRNNAGQDNFQFDGSGAPPHGMWQGDNHPLAQRPSDRMQRQPDMVEQSPDGRTINVYYINNAYFNGQNLGGYDGRQNPQYNFQNYDNQLQNLRQQQEMNYYNSDANGYPLNAQFQMQQQEMRREQQMFQYQQWQRQQQMLRWEQQQQMAQMYGGGGGYYGGGNYSGNAWGVPQYGANALSLMFNFGGGRHRRG